MTTETVSGLPWLALAAAVLSLTAGGCRKQSFPAPAGSSEVPEIVAADNIHKPAVTGGSEDRYIPYGLIYRMSGPYSEYVPVTLNNEHTAVVAYPAPSDLTDRSTPVEVGNGYLFDRRGISSNSAFVDITYADYRRMAKAPTASELFARIIPGAGITEIRRLPMRYHEAVENIDSVRYIVRHQLDECPVIYQAR